MKRKKESKTRIASCLVMIALLAPCIISFGQPESTNDLFYCTFLGGSHNDKIRDITLDTQGNILIVGGTFSENFPMMNAMQETYGGGELPQEEDFNSMGDGFVAKFSPDFQLLWSTYLGGTGYECALHVQVDSHDNIIVVGTTTSNDFPVTDGSTSSGKDGGDNFIARFDPDGQVIYSFYYATNEINSINSVEKTPVGEIVLAGGTSSTSFYCSEDAFQQELRGETDGFIRVLGEDLETIVFSTYLGGSGDDTILNLAVGQDGSIFISGSTKSEDFPVTENCIQSEYGGGSRDSFVAKVDPSRHLVMGTYLGGSDQEDIFGISEGPESVIVVGRTWSSDFPTTTNAYQHEYSKVEVDGFLCQISMLGDELLYSTFYGLNDWDSLLQVNVDNEGKFIITGFVGSGGFETVNAFQPEYMGLSDIIVMVWGKEIELISYLGSYELEHPFAQTISDGKMFIVGVTSSTQFQVSDNAYQTTHAGGDEGFIWVMDYQVYLSGEISDLDGKDASGSNFRLYISYGVVIGGIVLWFVYIKRSFAESY